MVVACLLTLLRSIRLPLCLHSFLGAPPVAFVPASLGGLSRWHRPSNPPNQTWEQAAFTAPLARILKLVVTMLDIGFFLIFKFNDVFDADASGEG